MGARGSRESCQELVLQQVTPLRLYNRLQDTGSYSVLLDLRPPTRHRNFVSIEGAVHCAPDATISVLGEAISQSLATYNFNSRAVAEFTVILVGADSPSVAEVATHAVIRAANAGVWDSRFSAVGLWSIDVNQFALDFPWASSTSFDDEDEGDTPLLPLYPSCVDEERRVFLSSWALAADRAIVVDALGCSHVVNCTPDHACCFGAEPPPSAAGTTAEEPSSPPGGAASAGVRYLRVPVVDDRDQDILLYLDAAVTFIDNATATGGRVLVHCRHGQSRSATVVAAWHLSRHLATATGARETEDDGAECERVIGATLAWLRECRPKVRPNDGFLAQLRLFWRARRDALRRAAEVASSNNDSTNPSAPHKVVVFLDVDGVLNSDETRARRHNATVRAEAGADAGGGRRCPPVRLIGASGVGGGCDEPDDELLGHACRAIVATGAQVIVSSTWRLVPGKREELRRALAARGVALSGATPDLENRCLGDRVDEIAAWLREKAAGDGCGDGCGNRSGSKTIVWVAIDDLDLAAMNPSLAEEHFVRTSGARGLTHELADEVVRKLRAQIARTATTTRHGSLPGKDRP